MLTKLTALFTALIMFLGNIWATFLPSAKKEALSFEELIAQEDIFDTYGLADEIVVVDSGSFTADELNTVICLEGLVAKVSPALYINYGGVYDTYIKEIENDGAKLMYTDENGGAWTLTSLINHFRAYITDGGMTVYRNSEYAEGLNTACNLATVYGWLAVPEGLEGVCEAAGLTVKKDISDSAYNYVFQLYWYRKLFKNFRSDVLVHVKSSVQGLRDFAIQQGIYILYSESNTFGEAFMTQVLSLMDDNTVVLGWGETENHFVTYLSEHSAMIIPADHSKNNSMLASYRTDIPEINTQPDVTADETRHYVAIVFSDGDNSQWVQGGYTEFYAKKALEKDFVMTWTYPAIQQELCSVSSSEIFSAADENDAFICGGSGVGYVHITDYVNNDLESYAEMTATEMAKSGMRIVSFLDTAPDDFTDATFSAKLGYFSRYDSIDGGLLMLDPDRYASGGGKVWFSNGKPFISVKLSLWYPEGEGSVVPDSWIEEQADIVNSWDADINSINGYSVINVHPWTISIDQLSYFVSLLDDGVELVTVPQMIKMIAENCPHTDATPE